MVVGAEYDANNVTWLPDMLKTANMSIVSVTEGYVVGKTNAELKWSPVPLTLPSPVNLACRVKARS